MGVYIGSVGAKAYKVSQVWRLGFHLFRCDGDLVLRFCYWRNKHSTYYIQVSYTYKTQCYCERE